MRVDLFDFELPSELIALRPARPRDSARLLLVEGSEIEDRHVLELPDLKAEFTSIPFLRGTFAAARANSVDSANSQFFIMFAPRPDLDNDYTIMGRVVSGMDAVDSIAPGEPPAEPTKIVKAYLGG